MELYSDLQSIQVWKEEEILLIQNISYNSNNTQSLFAASNGDLYIDNGINGHVDKWLSYTSTITVAFYVDDSCYGLFVDINDTLYCSMRNLHQVVKNPYNSGTNISVLVAGNGTNGSESNQLDLPHGIFVNNNFDLYVADAESNLLGSIVLNRPVGVILDNDGYLFILDNAETFANSTILGNSPFGLFVDASNTVYVNNRDTDKVIIWTQGSVYPTRNVSSSIDIRTLFVSIAGDIYISYANGGDVNKATPSQNLSATTTSFGGTCTSIFIDLNNTLYCSASWEHIVVKRALINDTQGISTVSGTRTNGSAPDMFSFPAGIFVDTNFTVYVADMYNHRIQRFYIGESNGTTIAGNGIPNNLTLNGPHDVMLDGNGACQETSNQTFNCVCPTGWNGLRCQMKIDYCKSIKCQNNALCRSTLNDYECECLSDSYSGRHCEVKSSRIQAYEVISKSFGYVAIIAIVATVSFVLIMDILKYCFGMDPTLIDLQEYRQEKKEKRHKTKYVERALLVHCFNEPCVDNSSCSKEGFQCRFGHCLCPENQFWAGLNMHCISCPKKWINLFVFCLYYQIEKANWINANRLCRGMNELIHMSTRLLVLDDLNKFHFISKSIVKILPDNQMKPEFITSDNQILSTTLALINSQGRKSTTYFIRRWLYYWDNQTDKTYSNRNSMWCKEKHWYSTVIPVEPAFEQDERSEYTYQVLKRWSDSNDACLASVLPEVSQPFICEIIGETDRLNNPSIISSLLEIITGTLSSSTTTTTTTKSTMSTNLSLTITSLPLSISTFNGSITTVQFNLTDDQSHSEQKHSLFIIYGIAGMIGLILLCILMICIRNRKKILSFRFKSTIKQSISPSKIDKQYNDDLQSYDSSESHMTKESSTQESQRIISDTLSQTPSKIVSVQASKLALWDQMETSLFSSTLQIPSQDQP
ncbi:hypothetical protein I4U23_019304 [Adineta vaga]|nr:hypothetical protein I4U23_019304 [Adineta vaga]